MRYPQNITTKAKRVLTDIDKGKDIDPFDRFHKMDGKADVEKRLGVLAPADLSEIDKNEAINYAAQDADVTLQIATVLARRMVEEGLPFDTGKYGELL